MITLALISNGCVVVVEDEYTSFKDDYVEQRLQEDQCKWHGGTNDCDKSKYEKEAQNRYLGIQPQHITIMREIKDSHWNTHGGCYNETSGKWMLIDENPKMMQNYLDLFFYPKDIRSYDSGDDLLTWEYDDEPYYYTILAPEFYIDMRIPENLTECNIDLYLEIASYYEWENQWHNWTETCEIKTYGNYIFDYHAEIGDCLHYGEDYYFPRPPENKI